MVMTFLVVAIVSGALVIAALWGIYGRLPTQLEGFIVALAGGAFPQAYKEDHHMAGIATALGLLLALGLSEL